MPSQFAILTNNSVPFRARDFLGNQTAYGPTHLLVDKDGNAIEASNALTVGGAYPIPVTATIGIGAALSGAVDLGRTVLAGIVMPAAWTAAVMTFDVSADNATFVPLKYAGAEVSLTVAASEGHSVDTSVFLGWRYLKVRSGTFATTVNQAAARTITLIGMQ
jgi:hypothetical protein